MSDSSLVSVNVNAEHRARLSVNERIALAVTERIGTMAAVYALTLVMAGWMLWQQSASRPFDPYPFMFLLFCSNVIQILLMPLIMVGQNLQGRHAELRAEHDLAVDIAAEAEIRAMQAKLDRLIVQLAARDGILPE